MAKICLCLTGKTIAEDLALVEKYRQYIDIVEIRADCLINSEVDELRDFPEQAGLPVILTVRRMIDGGYFNRGESSRIVLISKALAFPKADYRKNFTYVDIEDDIDIPSIEEVARTFGTRIIRSFHSFNGLGENFLSRVESLYRVGDEIAKAAIMPAGIEDVRKVFAAAKKLQGRDFILLAMGDLGQCTRILASKLGSCFTYTSPVSHEAKSAAPGQIDPVMLNELYHFRDITPKTAVYGLTGWPIKTSSSPQIHNTAIKKARIDAVYLRFPSETLDGFMKFAVEAGISGASVTVPHKETVLSYITEKSGNIELIGACNTIMRLKDGWLGTNTDALGFSASLLNIMKRTDLKRRKMTVVGAGGAARSIIAEAARLGAKVLVLNRNLRRAKDVAGRFGFEYAQLDEAQNKRIRKYSDIIVQTTSVGMEPDIDADPLPHYKFSGKEVVMDIIYKPSKTKFLARALDAGCTAINGYDMLFRQAKLQFECFFNTPFPE